MINLSGYQITEKIYAGRKSIVYRGIRLSDSQPVAIKILNNPYPQFKELVLFRNQYAIAKNLELPGIIKPLGLENFGQGVALILEDFGGISLTEYTAGSPLPLEQFFPIAIAIAQTLQGLYENKIIHKDIKPHNILINPQTKEVKVTDFSISTLLPRENQEILNPNVLEGTLAYISPEQSGRMNRGIDYRTDFYSLGITFYEVLTGQLPFLSTDAMELIHCHIAKRPKPPIKLIPTLPVMVNNIILKLMEKTPEERYQSAKGLRHDLENCWQQWQQKKRITPFQLGGIDHGDRFVIPEKLYGRETEVTTLLEAFQRVANFPLEQGGENSNKNKKGRVEMMLISGYSGIGKTAIVNEIHKPIINKRGYFIKGKFDQFQRNIPLSALVQAFQNLLRHILTESPEQVEAWHRKILLALGENAQVIIDVIPELERIIGPQPPVPELSGSASQNRFNILLQKFLKVFTTAEHPLVIFLDDLQWADAASLHLIELLMSDPGLRDLLIIGAYRDNEVNPAHLLMIALQSIRKNLEKTDNFPARINQIRLKPLSINSLNLLIADTLNCAHDRSLPLTKLVYQKTQGNPFFATQFLKCLHEDSLITFHWTCSDRTGKIKGGWQCDLAQVRSRALADNVVEFMGVQLQKLPKDTQDVLKIAACLGNEFNLNTLALVCQKTASETASSLWKSLEEGLILPLNNLYKFFADPDENILESEKMTISYQFLHDRVQQAAYFLIPDNEKSFTHFKIGSCLLKNTPQEAWEEEIFALVNHLNYGGEFVGDRAQREQLSRLNLIAGNKAKNSTAYQEALNYFSQGMNLLDNDSWQTQYELTLNLYVSAAEAAYLSTEFSLMENLVKPILSQGKNIVDKVKVYEVQLAGFTTQMQPQKAIKMGLEVLELLEISFPKEPSLTDIKEGLETTASLLTPKIGDLINLPIMTEADPHAALRILAALISPASMTAPNLFPLIILKMVDLSIRYGNAPLSAFAYGLYGLILSSYVQDITRSYELGQLALNLVERVNANSLKTKIFYTVGAHLLHGKKDFKDAITLLRAGYVKGLETGDLELGYSAKEISIFSYLKGRELSELQLEISNYSRVLKYLKQDTVFHYNQMGHQAVLNLLGRAETPFFLIGSAYNEEKMLPFHRQMNDRTGLHYLSFHKMIICYLLGDFKLALDNALEAEKYLDSVTGLVNVPIFYFYDSLIRLALGEPYGELNPEIHREKVAHNQIKLYEWATHAPHNFLHKFYLVEAEYFRLLDRKLDAIDTFDRAIALAKENEYPQEEAIAHELAAKFYLNWGKEKIAKTYLIYAYYGYANWGAKAKVEDLEKRYPQLLTPILNRETPRIDLSSTITRMTTSTVTSSSSGSAGVLDFSSVLKASQAISKEIIFDKLIATLMKTVIENAGADKGILIMVNMGQFVIECIAEIADSQVTISSAIPQKISYQIPLTLINYVSRMEETLLLNNGKNHQFSNDKYWKKYQPQSILCTPILKQNKVIGILYLENNLTSNAFTKDRLEIVKMLCSQATISLENAILYDTVEKTNQLLEDYSRTLEEKVEQRTVDLKKAQEQIIAQEKLASLGALTAGVAHELRNPLNFVNNYAESTVELSEELLQEIEPEIDKFDPDRWNYFQQTLIDIRDNAIAIHQHGKRADRIIHSMMQHGRSDSSQRQPTDLNAIVDQAVKLAYHSKRGSDPHFNLSIHKDYDQSIGELEIVSADLNRAFLNIIDNACYAVYLRQKQYQQQQENEAEVFTPSLWVKTQNLGETVEARIRDNGVGIAPDIQDNIFHPFFTTKPAGEGTGLGLSLAHDIIVSQHGGNIQLETKQGVYTEFIITLPKLISPKGNPV
jgi:predicted ATPase/signal transduction histidine kinase